MKTNRTQIMLRAWQLVQSEALSISEALRHSWQEYKLRAVLELLKAGRVRITFRKVSGEVATRYATRNSSLIPAEFAPKGVHSAGHHLQAIPFYSLTDHAWRSFKPTHLIRFQAA